MSKQHIDIDRNALQNKILHLEKKYMDVIEEIITSDNFINDLKNIEAETQEYYDLLTEVWGKKNKIKEASERLLRHHMYTSFPNAQKFYPSPISSDIALELDDIVLNIDVKTIDKIGNSGDLKTTQFEHNQTSFVNKPVLPSGEFPGFQVKSNLKSIDPRTKKPILSYLVKIVYADNGKGCFNLLNSKRYPSMTLTCIPNGALSNLFENDLFGNFKDYTYFNKSNGNYYQPKFITTQEDFKVLDVNGQFVKIEQNTDIPDTWKRLSWNQKVGYFDIDKQIVWQIVSVKPKKQKHRDIYLKAVKYGNTARFNDDWLKERYDENDNKWLGKREYCQLYS